MTHVIYRLLGRDRNSKLLQVVPHIPYLDLAIVFYQYVRIPDYGSFVMQITGDMMKNGGMTLRDLFRQAKQNTPVLLPCKFCGMNEILRESFPFLVTREGEGLFVLTNEDRRYGAAALLYDGQLARIGCSLKENFYILPSSVHETIIVPSSEAPDRADMCEIVREINGSFMEPEDILSDAVYYYDCETGCLGQI